MSVTIPDTVPRERAAGGHRLQVGVGEVAEGAGDPLGLQGQGGGGVVDEAEERSSVSCSRSASKASPLNQSRSLDTRWRSRRASPVPPARKNAPPRTAVACTLMIRIFTASSAAKRGGRRLPAGCLPSPRGRLRPPPIRQPAAASRFATTAASAGAGVTAMRMENSVRSLPTRASSTFAWPNSLRQ